MYKLLLSLYEVIEMSKISGSAAEKLKNMARGLKEEESSTGIKRVADKIKTQSQAHKKENLGSGKVSGRKD